MSATRKYDKEKILSVAMDLFLEKGYLETRIIDIAEACSMGKGTFYEYFPSKEALFGELFQIHVLNQYNDFRASFQSSQEPAREKLLRFIRMECDLADRLGNQKNFVDNLFSQFQKMDDPEVMDLIRKFTIDRFELVHSIIKKGIECNEFRSTDSFQTTAVFMGALSFYTSLNYKLLTHIPDTFPRGTSLSPEEREKQFLELIFRGLASEQERLVGCC